MTGLVRSVLCCVATLYACPPSLARDAASDVGLQGYCPVLATQGRWELGKKEHAVVLDDQIYRCSSAEAALEFNRSPVLYAPALEGDCIVCWVRQGTRIEGSIFHAIVHRCELLQAKRIYLFPSKGNAYTRFLQSPNTYEAQDIWNTGQCPITGGKGDPQHACCRKGIWYLCANEDALNACRDGWRSDRPQDN